MNRTRQPPSRLLPVALLGIVALAVAACGDNAPSSPSGSYKVIDGRDDWYLAVPAYEFGRGVSVSVRARNTEIDCCQMVNIKVTDESGTVVVDRNVTGGATVGWQAAELLGPPPGRYAVTLTHFLIGENLATGSFTISEDPPANIGPTRYNPTPFNTSINY